MFRMVIIFISLHLPSPFVLLGLIDSFIHVSTHGLLSLTVQHPS